MASVLDSLVVELGLDATGFTRGERDALQSLRQFNENARTIGNEVEASGKKIMEVFSGLRGGALGLVGGFLGGAAFEQLLSRITNLDAATGRMARNIGLSVENLSAWQNAARATGGTAEGITATLRTFNDQLQMFTFGVPSQLTGLLRNFPGGGINPFDAMGRIRDAGSIMLEIAERIERMGLSPEKASPFLRMMGMDDSSINLILMGSQRLRALLETQREIGGTTAESARLAQEYQTQLVQVETAATNLGRTLLVSLAPSLTATANSLVKLIGQFKDLYQAMTRGDVGTGNFLGGSEQPEIQTPLTRFGHWLHDLIFGASGGPFGNDTIAMQMAKERLAAGLRARGSGGGTASGDGTSNMSRFLSGLSYLETNQTNVGNAFSSAQGYFQFLSGTANRAMAAGLPDPRVGSYQQQADATAAFIKKFHPDAAAAIDRGDYNTAITILRGEWPSLPGGSQPQDPSRYDKFRSMVPMSMRGGDTNSSTSSVNVANVNVYTQATDATNIAKDIKPAIERIAFSMQANYGQDG